MTDDTTRQKRLNAYSRPAPHGGGVTIDIEAMMVDLITFAKAGGIPKPVFMAQFTTVWDDVTVDVSIPPQAKN